jgi:hypothetical protein
VEASVVESVSRDDSAARDAVGWRRATLVAEEVGPGGKEKAMTASGAEEDVWGLQLLPCGNNCGGSSVVENFSAGRPASVTCAVASSSEKVIESGSGASGELAASDLGSSWICCPRIEATAPAAA